MIHKVELGSRMRYGINWRIDDKTHPRSLMIAFVFPVWILPRERYMPSDGYYLDMIGRRLKVVGFKITLQAKTWEAPIGKQEYPPIGEYLKEK
jgi:hypothetical protein